MRDIGSDGPAGKEGVVIVMDPDENRYYYLVEFDDSNEGYTGGEEYYDKPWYPSKYKTESHSRSWCSENGLELVSAAPSHQQSEPMFKVGQKVRVIGGKNCGSKGFVSEMEKFQGQVMTVQTVFREDRKSCDCSYHFQLEEDDYCVWSSKWLEPIEEEEKKASLVPVVSDATNGEAKPACAKSYGEAKEVIEVQEGMPEWLKEMILNIKAGVAHFFIVWGNIYDLQKNKKSAYTSLYQCLLEAFEQREMIMSYSVSAGLQFANAEMEKAFRRQYLAEGSQVSDEQKKQSAIQNAAKQRQNIEAQMPFEKTPDKILPLLEKALINANPESSGKNLLIVDFAHNLAPNHSAAQANWNDRVSVETLERWARDWKIKESGNIIILLTSSLTDIAEPLRFNHSGAKIIRISKPDDAARISRWENRINANGVALEDGLNAQTLGRITSGLSLVQIDNIYSLAKAHNASISLGLIKKRKQEILEQEFGDRVKVKIPEWGFDYFGGKENVKEYLLEVRDNILKGVWRRVPMGILASGPPGTGKTFLFECWAYECGFNFVKIENPRNMFVGESERIMAGIFSALDDLAPVVVVEDEADQSETSRDMPSGDSGVSNRLRQMKFEFCSDPKRRGKVIWVRISNRDDLIDAAYKRKGRTDDNIPFVLPTLSEYEDIFRVMFARYKIQTAITDFSPFAKSAAAGIYCTGADIEWMVLEADKYAGREGKDSIDSHHLMMAINDWEMDLDPREIDRQTILAIKGSSKRLRPDHWKKLLADAEARLKGHQMQFV